MVRFEGLEPDSVFVGGGALRAFSGGTSAFSSLQDSCFGCLLLRKIRENNLFPAMTHALTVM